MNTFTMARPPRRDSSVVAILRDARASLGRQLPELDDQPVRVVAVGGAVAGEVAGVHLLRWPGEAYARGGETGVLGFDVVDEECDVVRADVRRLRSGGKRRALGGPVFEQLEERGPGTQLDEAQPRARHRHLSLEHLAGHLGVQGDLHPQQVPVEAQRAVEIGHRPRGVVEADDHRAVQPPSTTRLAPWTNRAASEARNTTTGAMSSTSPQRPQGVSSATRRSNSGSARNGAFIGVRICPGATQLTRIRLGPRSSASAFAISSTAPFVAQEAGPPTQTCPEIEE